MVLLIKYKKDLKEKSHERAVRYFPRRQSGAGGSLCPVSPQQRPGRAAGKLPCWCSWTTPGFPEAHSAAQRCLPGGKGLCSLSNRESEDLGRLAQLRAGRREERSGAELHQEAVAKHTGGPGRFMKQRVCGGHHGPRAPTGSLQWGCRAQWQDVLDGAHSRSRAQGLSQSTPQKAMLLQGRFHGAGSLVFGEKVLVLMMEGYVQNNPSRSH